MAAHLRRLAAAGKLLAESAWAVLGNPRQLASVARLDTMRNFLTLLRQGDTALLRHRLDLYFRQAPRADGLSLLAYQTLTLPIRLPAAAAPRVSIIVPAYNQYAHTLVCLSAIAQHTQAVSYEVILADDGSTDATTRIDEAVENLRVVRPAQNLGFLGNCNHAAREARGEILVLLNNDTIVQPGWLDALVGTLDQDARVGLVGAKLLYPDGTLQEAGGILWRDASGCNYGRGQAPERPEFNYLKEVDYVSGACIALRAALWREVGGFDVRFSPAYYEDADLAFSVRALGYRVVYQPRAQVIHLEGQSHGTRLETGIKRHQALNRETFREKWAAVLDADHAAGPASLFTARDRSGERQTVLVIDHYVPMPDRDAGSKMISAYLRLLVQMGYNVKFLGDHFYSEEPYAGELAQLGIEVLGGAWYRDHHRAWLSEHLPYLDHVVLCRPHIASKYIDLFAGKLRGKLIYVGVDLHYLREERRYAVEGDARHLAAARQWKALELAVMRRADVSLTPSEFEREAIAALVPDKSAVTIPLFVYESNERQGAGFAARADVAFVGGFGHPPNTQGVHWFLDHVWPTLRARLGCRLLVIGANPPESLLARQGDDVVVVGAVSEAQLQAYYRTCRIFVAPLHFGAGVKGKVVEAMKHQVPLVATALSYEGLPGLDDQPLIRPCDDAASFADEVERLYTDEAAWRALSEAYFDYISRHFMVETARAVMQRVLAD